MVAHTRAGDKPSPKKLSFHEKLSGKGLTTDAVLKKLKALHTELSEMDQELVDVSSLNVARKELVSTSIMLHKDRGVKAYAACCLADILRLYAPDAPYTQNELRDIFQFFFRQLTTGLKGTDSSYYTEYFHLLESLSTVKSVVLVCDLPNAEELMADIFRDFFGLVRRDLAKKIEMFMADILVALIDECQALPSEVLETIMAQFMDKNSRMDQPAYLLAVTVCNATSDKLQRHVCQYFTDIIVSNSREEDFEEIRTAHDLVKELNRSCPALLTSVIPQLEEELRVEEVQLRLIATGVLGDMFSDRGGADMAKKYPSTWNVFLQRKNDKTAAVRLRFVEAAKGLLINLTQHRDVIEESLNTKLFDPDDKVRAAVCKVYSQLDYEMTLHHTTEAQLRAIAGRGLDKKHLVRVEALNCIGKLFSVAYPEIENGDPAAVKQFSWIPNEILHISQQSQQIRAITEQVICDYILPLPSPSSGPSTSKGADVDDTAWTDRLLNTMKYLDDTAVKSLLLLTNIKASRPTLFEHFIKACEKNNGGIIDADEEAITQRLNAVIQRLAGSFPDRHKASEDLQSFAKANEQRLYKILKTCTESQTDLKGLVKNTSEFLRRVEQSSPAILPTMTILIRRASLRIVNQSSVPTLLKRVQKGDGTLPPSLSHTAQTLLIYMSKNYPALYQLHVGELAKALADEKNPKLVEVSLQALAAVAQLDEKHVPHDKRTLDRVMRYVLDTNARHAKFAARLFAFSKNRDELCAEVVETISERLPDANPEQLVAHITVLAQLSRFAPDAFETRSEVIMAFLVKDIVMQPSPPDQDTMDDGEEWAEDDDVSLACKAKILSLKVCRNRCIAHAAAETALDISKPVVKMLATILHNRGSLTADSNDNPKVQSRMRLQAAGSLLHLSTIQAFFTAISPHFVTLATTIQDSCYQVRLNFLTKLLTLVQPRKLDARFNVIPFLTVLDPEEEVKDKASQYVIKATQTLPTKLKVDYFEAIFIRLLHLLAHHPDFSVAHEFLMDFAKYIDFYLDLVATPDNISLLYHLAMKAKTVRDPESHTHSENLYAMSELAQELIKNRTQAHSWSLQSFPGKVKLPPDILRALPSAEAANKILKTVYLPEETSAWLAEMRTKAGPNKEKRRLEPREPKEPKERKIPVKRKAPTKANGSAKRSRAKKWNSDDSDEAEDSDRASSDGAAEEPEDAAESAASSNENEVVASSRDEKLGRGARTRANTKIRKQIKKSAPKSSNHPSSEA
ncbi:ARM repeat-containing protein [Athelia psychrophila]|uniref:ARM repeat-containing protein n=1 Tax=Athelia psychrophila TaxID=1759441 RepID=A0A166P4J9_9AGAM|nr:ARM repeat-containing protein [Fibularhizoctonia sp. CBS 109695]